MRGDRPPEAGMATRLVARTEAFPIGDGKAIVHWVEVNLREGPSRLALKVVTASHPRGASELLKVADSLRRIKAAGAGSVRGSVTGDDVLVVSRSSEPRSGYRLRVDDSILVGRDAVEFGVIRGMVETGRLDAEGPPECTRFKARGASAIEETALRNLISEGRILYSVRASANCPSKSREASVRVAPTLPIGFAAHYESLPDICGRHRAQAGINGGFFANFEEEMSPHTVFNDPVGLLLTDGRVMVPPSYRRGTLLVFADGDAQIRTTEMGMVRFSLGGRSFAREGKESSKAGVEFAVNPQSVAEAGVHTCASRSGTPAGKVTDFAVSGSSVVEVKKGGGCLIPQGGFVLQVGNPTLADDLMARITEGTNAVDYELELPGTKGSVEQGLAAGPILLKDGKAIDEGYFEHAPRTEEFEERKLVPTRLKLAISDPKARAPRSAVGVKGRGSVMLVTVDDDRQTNLTLKERRSVGATLSELAEIMRQLGCSEAVNLDGGGSSTLWLGGRIANRPSDGFARSISTAVLITSGS